VEHICVPAKYLSFISAALGMVHRMESLDLTEDGSSDNLGGDSDSQLENSLVTDTSGNLDLSKSRQEGPQDSTSTPTAEVHKVVLFDIGEEGEEKVSS